MNRIALMGLVALVGCGPGAGDELPLSVMKMALTAEAPSAQILSELRVTATLTPPAETTASGVQTTDLSGRLVNFVVTKGDGSVWVEFGETDATGAVRNSWTLGPKAGPQEIEVRAIDDAGNPVIVETLTAEAVPGPAVSAVWDASQAYDQHVADGETWDLSTIDVRAHDVGGNRVEIPREFALLEVQEWTLQAGQDPQPLAQCDLAEGKLLTCHRATTGEPSAAIVLFDFVPVIPNQRFRVSLFVD